MNYSGFIQWKTLQSLKVVIYFYVGMGQYPCLVSERTDYGQKSSALPVGKTIWCCWHIHTHVHTYRNAVQPVRTDEAVIHVLAVYGQCLL